MPKDALIGKKLVEEKLVSGEEISLTKTIISHRLSVSDNIAAIQLEGEKDPMHFTKSDVDLMINGGVTTNHFYLAS